MELDDASLRAMRGNIDIIDLVTMLLVFPLFITSIFSGSWCMRRYNATRNRLYMFAYLVHPIYAILALLLARIWLLYYGVPVFGSSVRLGPFVPNSCAVLKATCPETLWMPCYVGFVRAFLGQVMGTRHPDWSPGHIALGFLFTFVPVGLLSLFTAYEAWCAYTRWWDCSHCGLSLPKRQSNLMKGCNMDLCQCDNSEKSEKHALDESEAEMV